MRLLLRPKHEDPANPLSLFNSIDAFTERRSFAFVESVSRVFDRCNPQYFVMIVAIVSASARLYEDGGDFRIRKFIVCR